MSNSHNNPKSFLLLLLLLSRPILFDTLGSYYDKGEYETFIKNLKNLFRGPKWAKLCNLVQLLMFVYPKS